MDRTLFSWLFKTTLKRNKRLSSSENEANIDPNGFPYVTFQDKRNATKKYKDMYTELSIMRAKTEREMEELRENLRLAHRALEQS